MSAIHIVPSDDRAAPVGDENVAAAPTLFSAPAVPDPATRLTAFVSVLRARIR